MDIVKKFLKTSIELEAHYHDFWDKIFHNDAYVFIKNAIEFYKNIQNNNFHTFYSSIINIRLYTGKCVVVSPNTLNSFNNKNNKNRISSDELCNLTIEIINILDHVFENCPRLPINTTVFRYFRLHKDDLLLSLKEGDFYRELGINSTTINPYYMFDRGSIFGISSSLDLEKEVYLTIILQKGTMCYYTNIPWHNSNKYYQNEFELVLPRDCVYIIKSKKEFQEKIFITLELVYQIPPIERPIKTIAEILPVRKLDKKNYKYWKPSKEKKEENNWTIKIYKEQYALWNKLPNDQKYEVSNSIIEKIHPKKFWIYIISSNKNFIALQKNKMNIPLILDINTVIITNDKYLYLPEKLSDSSCEKYFTKNGNNTRNKFFEIDRKIPLLYLIEVDKCKEISVKKYYSYMWTITKKIKIIIKSIEYKEVVDEYKYAVVKAIM